MVSINTIEFSLEQIAKSETVLLVDIEEIKEYKNGGITENVEGTRYTIVCPKNRFEKLGVKVKERKPSITLEQLEKKEGALEVTFINFKGKFYQNKNKDICFYAYADSVKVVEE